MPKGLGALIPESEKQQNTTRAAAMASSSRVRDGDRILNIPLGKIRPNTEQPRSYFEPKAMNDLAESIRQHGILQPLERALV